MLREAENNVIIEGMLIEVDIQEREGKEPNNPYLFGKYVVRVEQEIDGIAVVNEVPIQCFSTKLTKAGKTNPSYTNINKLRNEFRSLAATGDPATASYISVTRGRLEENSFWGRDGNLVNGTRISANFMNQISKIDCKNKAEFSLEMVIGAINEEYRDDEATGNLLIKGIVPKYGGRVDVMDFIVKKPSAVDHIQSNWNRGDTVRVMGKINYTYRVERTEIEMGFGDPEIKERTISVKELVITSGSPAGYDEDRAYDAAEIKTALTNRSIYHEELKTKAAQKKEPKETFGDDLGF